MNPTGEFQNILWHGWYKFDYKIMKPLLTNQGPPLGTTCPSFCAPITNCFTSPDAYASNDDDNEVRLITKYNKFCTTSIW